MSLIDQIDFLHHDGVNRAMINDFMRNQFYDNIFRDTVRDRRCVDIGFGTGLLSILALKHGAKSVIAYESDPARYELGQQVIQTLGLTQITLLHERYNYHMLPSDAEVIFSETVNGNLWQEGLFYSLPRQPGIEFLPGQYFLEVYACPVPDVFAQGLAHPTPTTGFSPGIDIDQGFVDLINRIGFDGRATNHTPITDSIQVIDTGLDTEWGWIPFMRLCVNNGQLVARYSVDAKAVSVEFLNQTPVSFNFDNQNIVLTVDMNPYQNQSVILVPRVGMSHHNHKLMLDTGHWGPTMNPVVISKPQGQIIVSHNLLTGDIAYNNA